MNYLIATDSFKDSLRSQEVGMAFKNGILKGDPKANVVISPIADGGEGTVDALMETYGKRAEKIQITVHDPRMKPINATYMLLETEGEKIAFIEAAESSGLMLVPHRDRNPMVMNTFGFGEQIRHALRKGIRNFVLSLGGSATNDGGVGMLQALGWEFFDEVGRKIESHGNPLLNVASFSNEKAMPELKHSRFQIASDVLNPFYGKSGAAQVFAKQKGASDKDIRILDERLKKLAKLFQSEFAIDIQKIKGSGAAGGLGGAVVACLGGTIHSGVETIIRLTHLEQKIKEADVIITGEGSLDDQSMMGKVPIGVAKVAKKYGKKVIGIGGRIDMNLQEINKYIDAVFSIQTECRTLQEALQPEIARKQVEITAEQIAHLLRK